MAENTGLPIVWLEIGDAYAIDVDGIIFHPKNDFEAFYIYYSSFSIFGIEWDCLPATKNKKKVLGFPNRGAIELIHWYVC